MTRLLNKRIRRINDQHGFTILEVLVAIFILLIGVLATVTLLNTANASTERNQARNGATNLVRDIIEASRALPYDETTATTDSSGNPDTSFEDALKAMAPTTGGSRFVDADTTVAGWQIRRRGVNYTVTLAACVVDDAKDSVAASHSPAASNGTGYYCPNLPTSPTGDTNGDDYRRVSVTASWTSNSCNSCSSPQSVASPKTYAVTQTGVIINPTGGLGPAPVSLTNTGVCPAARSVTAVFLDKDTQGAVFTVNDPGATTTTLTTASSTSAGPPKTITYTFTYNPTPAPPDNTYQVTATAFNSTGQFGRQIVADLPVNCNPPQDPTGVAGGFDWRRCIAYPATCGSGERIFDLDWNQNPEADVIAYYVYRVAGSADWTNPGGSDPTDPLVTCVGKAGTTDHPGPNDFLEPFQPACWDTGVAGQPSLGTVTGLVTFPGTVASYYVRAVDPDPSDPTGATRRIVVANHSPTFTVTENMLNVRPTSPVLSVTNSSGVPCLSWTNSVDLDALGADLGASSIKFYRIYRSATVPALVDVGGGVQVFDVPYSNRIGRTQPNLPSSCDATNPTRSFFLDTTAGSSSWNYWVTAVDTKYLESFASNTGAWTAPAGP